jgi:hypothetical protein
MIACPVNERMQRKLESTQEEVHYLAERFHQGIGGQLIRNVGPTNDNGAEGSVRCRSRLGGLLNFYHREAA